MNHKGMNREILFRGKVVSGTWKGKWIEGYLEDFNDIDDFRVDPETVGEYTGLTDKNGKKIFEGDIVKITDTIVGYERLAVIEFGNPNGIYSWGWQLRPISKEPFAVDILHWVDMEETGAFIEVIGNIHDNAELLDKVGE